MSVFRLVLRANNIRTSLASSLKQIRDAQLLLDTSHERVIDAQERVAREGKQNSVPDPSSMSSAEVELICAIDDWMAVRRQIQAPVDEARRIFDDYATSIRLMRSRRAIFRNILSQTARAVLPRHIALADTALTGVSLILSSKLTRKTLTRLARQRANPAAALANYRKNNAYVVAALEHFRDLTSTDRRPTGITGSLPNEIALRVEGTPLLRGAFTGVLRRYQDFGARYVIAQQRVILGDEMGLGKTVQALAALCHMHALGARKLLVVAPNSVLINWERETRAHTSLEPIILHGSTREQRVHEWTDSGCIGITTFGTLPKIAHLITALDVLVVDEAHNVKNPNTLRTAAIQSVASIADNVIMMTGTALENRLAEFKSLALLAQPALETSLAHVSEIRQPDPDVVSTMLAPVYLRRTQQDVLVELPERIHVDEWVDLSDDDWMAYLEAPPNLMQKRLTACIGHGTGVSAKYARLLELIEDHREAGHKIVVFSFFRRVIGDISHLLGCEFIITGDSRPSERQNTIDAFGDSPPGTVLLSQIEAGGTGINLQMAQVVILVEPQFKPSTEWQAVSRVHRMGQSKPVVVHRLLARGTVDEHLVALIQAKEIEFFAYAHDSAVKHESHMATDIGNADTASRLQQMLDSGEIT